MLSKHLQDNSNRNLLTDTFSFENFVDYNGLYVDKTEYLYKLITSGKRLYFFSRPRRFGKSLTLSTLKAIFQGKKDLFKDLYIENQDYDWKKYPVIHLDMGSNASDTPEKLEEELISIVNRSAYELKIELTEKNYNKRFEELIYKLNERDGKVVVLIDEYDKPILNNIELKNIDEFQKIMKGFYSVLKTCEAYERFVFITGVGKFLKVSIFSDLNNLNDISMSDDYAAMCGYTEKELKENFDSKIKAISEKENIDFDVLLEKIKKWYDGYKFSVDGENVYNPVSFAKFLDNKGRFNNYWFETGSPSIVIKLLKTKDINIDEVIKNHYTEDIFTAYMPSKIEFIPMMYQTGYLTIKKVIKEENEDSVEYSLGFPNKEVEDSFYRRLIISANEADEFSGIFAKKLRNALKNNEIDNAMTMLRSFFAEIPYEMQIKNEKYYQSIFYAIFKSLGFSIKPEVQTSNGRIDAVVENDENIYIFEFKLDKSEKAALDQILNKEYYLAYQNKGKKITLIGANFNSETRRLSDWVTKVC